MTKDIQAIMAKYLILKGNEAVCENYGAIFFEMDIASVSKVGMLHEYEVKISRSDFLADKNKGSKHAVNKFDRYAQARHDGFGCPNFFYYVCPDKLISKAEIPVFAGLYYIIDGEAVLIKAAKKLHPKPCEREKVLSKMLRMIIQRKYLGGTMLTYKNNIIKERYKERQTEKADTLENLIKHFNPTL